MPCAIVQIASGLIMNVIVANCATDKVADGYKLVDTGTQAVTQQWIHDGKSFIPPKPYPSWIYDGATKTYAPPAARPKSGRYYWDETTRGWVTLPLPN